MEGCNENGMTDPYEIIYFDGVMYLLIEIEKK